MFMAADVERKLFLNYFTYVCLHMKEINYKSARKKVDKSWQTESESKKFNDII